MSRNILVCGLLLAGLAFAGCSSSSKSGTAGDGSLAGADLAGQTAMGDGPGAGGAGGNAGAGTLTGNGDAKTGSDGSTHADGGPGGDAKAGGDLAGGTGGGDGGPGLYQDARVTVDQTQPRDLPDATPGLGDAGTGQDVAQQTDGVPAADVKPTADGLSDSSRRDGPKDTGSCNLPDYGLSMPAEQKEIVEKYAVCQYSTGQAYTDGYGETVLMGTSGVLMDAKRCVDSSDPLKGKTTGSSYRLAIGAHGYTGADLIRTNTSRTQRIYVLKVAPDGTEARAAYDLVSTTLPGGMAPDYPERYARLDLVCGDASAFPEFDGWTGRIDLQGGSRHDNPPRVEYGYYFVGSVKGESGDRALYFETQVLD